MGQEQYGKVSGKIGLKIARGEGVYFPRPK